MWQVDNRTPFAAERGWVRDRTGAEVWLVAVKCTFDIEQDGSTAISEEQPPVLRVPEPYGEPGTSSLKYEADLVLTKTTTDIIVVGHAYAPGGRPVTQLSVGFRVGPVQKVLRVFGDRRWGAFGPSSPEPFTAMPLVYERAFGGVDRASQTPERDCESRNPVGTAAVARDHLSGVALPNISIRTRSSSPGRIDRARRGLDRLPVTGSREWGLRARMATSGWSTAAVAARRLRRSILSDAPADQQAASFLRVERSFCITSRPPAIFFFASEGLPRVRDALPRRQPCDPSGTTAPHRHPRTGPSTRVARVAYGAALPLQGAKAGTHGREAQSPAWRYGVDSGVRRT